MHGIADSAGVALALPALSIAWAAGLMSIRVATALVLTPILQPMSLPATMKVLLVLGLSLVLVMGLQPVADLPSSLDAGALALASLSEASLGMLLGLGVASAFAAVGVAANLLDVQLGFGLAQVVDPLTRRRIPVLTATFNLIAALAFMMADGHHAVLRALAISVERFPLGEPWPLQMSAGHVIQQFAGLYSLGLALAAPVMVAVLLTDLALMVLMRNLPQMNMFVVGTPLKIVVGLAGLALWVKGMGAAMGRIHAFVFHSWAAIFAGN